MKKLTIDVGGTHLRFRLDSAEGSVWESYNSSEWGLLEFIDSMMSLHEGIGSIAISYAGQVDRGTILSAPNIRIDEPAIKAAVESRYDVTLWIDNDLNCAVRAEAAYWKCDTTAALSVGTGIGAAVIDNGRLIRGARSLTYEIGHIPYRNAPFACGCGRENCIELFASGSGMEKWLRHGGIEEPVNLHRLKHSDSEAERRIALEFERALLYAAGTLVTLANPKLLVLGGGIIQANPYLIDHIREKIVHYALAPSLEHLRIEMSVLENAPLEGAKLLEDDTA